MKGMDLSRAYCERYAASLFAGGLEGLRQRCALGLVGPGSECLGFDDQISRDHDFGPGFCIWLEPADFAAFGAELQRRYDELQQKGDKTPYAQILAETKQRDKQDSERAIAPLKHLREAVIIVLAVSFLSLGLRTGMVVAGCIPLVLAAVFCASFLF